MAIIRMREMRELSDVELADKEKEFRTELNAERGKVATGGRTSTPGKIRELKKSCARILTILTERKLGIAHGSAKAAAKEESKQPAEGGKNKAKAARPAEKKSEQKQEIKTEERKEEAKKEEVK